MTNNSLIDKFRISYFQWWWHFQQICSKFTSLSTARQIYHWPAHNSANLEFAYSPYSSHPRISHCPKNAMFCIHWWLTIHQWTEFSISNSTYVQISYVKYIPPFLLNLARLQTEKFLVLPTKSWNDTNTCSKFPWWQDSVQLITYTVPQNCLSLFTIHCNSQFPYVQLTSAVELSVFCWGSSLE